MRTERRGDRKVGPARTAKLSAAAPLLAVPVDREAAVESWFARRGWTIFPFQRETWRLMAEGKSGLLHATTGSGKTLAVAFGAWLAMSETAEPDDQLRVLWVTPMRALAADTERSLREAFDGFAEGASGAPTWRIAARTGDTSSSERTALTKKPPRLLVTTPESLTLMLTQDRARETFASLSFVIVDEWHELLGNKRGVQTQLALARLRHFRPGLATWGLSATLGNLEEARRVLLGPRDAERGALVEGRLDKPLVIDTLLPKSPERFPWAGHLGAKMVEPVVAEIEAASTTLVFTNTRSQAELWYQHILRLRPDWAGIVAIHHGSLVARDARLGGAGAEGWIAQGRRLHFEPRSRRGFPARRARDPDRLAQGRRSAPAAGRAKRPRAGPRLARHARSHAIRSNSSRRPRSATRSPRKRSRAGAASMRPWTCSPSIA